MSLSLLRNSLCEKFLRLTIGQNPIAVSNRYYFHKVKLRHPHWHIKKQRVIHDDFITPENRNFIQEVTQNRIDSISVNKHQLRNTPLQDNEPLLHGEWNTRTRRTGLIARKIGDYPLWSNNGRRILTTLLQVVDNQVIKYTPPEEWEPPFKNPVYKQKKTLGSLIVGAETVDATTLTKDYYGIFEKAGVTPKKNLFRFLVSPEAALAPGTPLFASHFRVGDVIDVRGKTISHGFQGVVKRWGFKGMPASHGVTKTHRRPGNIGSGGEKARVWPGQKMPGHMGNAWRVLRGVRILRINRKYNVLWVEGVGIPGPTNGICYLFDTVLPLKKLTTAPPFPTYIENENEEEETLLEGIHSFISPTITFSE